MNKKVIPVNNYVYSTPNDEIVEIQVQVDPRALIKDQDSTKTYDTDSTQLQLSTNQNPWKDLGVPDYVAKAKKSERMSSSDDSSDISRDTSSSSSHSQLQSQEKIALKIDRKSQIPSRLPPSSNFSFFTTSPSATGNLSVDVNQSQPKKLYDDTDEQNDTSPSSASVSSSDNSSMRKKQRTDSVSV
jgi:hypothetical protein